MKKTHDKGGKTFWVASAHSILIGVILLGSVSWAWFSETVDAPDITVQTASYGIRAEVSGNGTVTGGDYSSVTDGDYIAIEVESGAVHDITLTGLGTAGWNGGYCVVSAGDNMRYTQRIYPDGTLKFQIFFSGTENGRIEFLPYWGYYPNTILEEGSDKTEDIKTEYVIENEGKYVVSGGDFVVSGGDVAGKSADDKNERK